MPLRSATTSVSARLAVVAFLALVTCAACGSPAPPPSLARCSAFGVQAIRRHVVVKAVPAACAGLSHALVNQAVTSAIREAVGPLPKAAARGSAARDSRYLAALITPIAAPPAAALSSGSSPPSGGRGLALFAIGCWVATASAGSYLLARTGAFRRRQRRRPGRGSLATIIIGHIGAAVSSLGTLAAFAVTGVAAVGWAAAALVSATAGLGMATLVTALPEPGAASEPRSGPEPGASRVGRRQSPVAVIAVHGILATVTILLVWLAAVSGS
jgi:hypothetical protein